MKMKTNQRSLCSRKSSATWVLALAAASLCGCDMLTSPIGGSSWDGQEGFVCGGTQDITLEDLTVTFTPDPNDPFPHHSYAISAGGRCKLTLINCSISAPQVISAGGDSQVIIKGGRIAGEDIALAAESMATIEVADGADIVGPVESSGSAKLIGISEQEAKETSHSLDSSGEGACGAVIDCYAQHQAFGNVQGLVTGQVDATGQVTSADYSEGDAPEKVQLCLIEDMKQKSIKDFEGGPGKLQCQYAGMLTAETQALSFTPRFVQ